MPSAPKLNREDQRIQIWTLRNEGLSWKNIVSKTNKDRRTCQRIFKRVKETGSFKDKTRPGRPRKIDDRNKRHLVRLLQKGKDKNAEALRKDASSTLNLKVCRNTIAKALKESGYACRVKRKKPLLTMKHKRARLAWAKAHQTWTVEEWKKVIWSDETAFLIVNGQGREYCFTKNGDVLEDAQIQPTKKYGGGKVMVWSCITYEGVGFSCRIDGNLDGELYTDILRDELMKTIKYYQMDQGEVIFQQDNDPKHTSRVAKDALEDLDLNVMDWPSQSPDLNPIEHMWNHLKTELRSKSKIFATADDLWDGIQEVMKNENKEMCQKLISSMSSRVQAVINAKGGYTKY